MVRNLTGNSLHRGRDLFPPVVNEQWRPRLVRVSTTYPSKSPEEDKEEPNQAETSPLAPNIPQIPTMEAVMEDLHEVTRQYLSCPDPVEAAARRQRVLHGDAQGHMEETATAIIAAARKRQDQQALVFGERTSQSNPVTPPPPQTNLFHGSSFPGPSGCVTPPLREEEDFGGVPLNSASPRQASQSTLPKDQVTSAKFKSNIVSPVNNSAKPENVQPLMEPDNQSAEEETLKEFQDKFKKKENITNSKLTCGRIKSPKDWAKKSSYI
ncbi:hypothetical protein IGI04_017280 [Brassica rapa subsp. trilocularis]|uniref:Uncharacterized protein n=1 Tax=Brassica rapa subsp. trilocularis TaxID=1813537 RepID=A0ABQ7MDA9_BRACM|nr:hypothetical protein IGI04_017280 [Brassica rapa subsp. trilocularis]